MQGKVHYFLDGPLFEKILRILIIVVGGFAIPAVFLWFLSFLGAKENPLASGTPFTLAQVMAIFGGFGLVAGFSDNVACDLRHSLRLMATLFLLSALCFCLMGMLLPALAVAEGGTASTYLLVGAVLGTIAVSSVSFCLGTFMWADQLGGLINKTKKYRAPKNCSACCCNRVESIDED